MHDRSPIRTGFALLAPAAMALAAAWLLFGSMAQDALFAALKLVVTR